MQKQEDKMIFRVVRPDEITAVKQEVKAVFFSGDPITIDRHFEDHTKGPVRLSWAMRPVGSWAS